MFFSLSKKHVYVDLDSCIRSGALYPFQYRGRIRVFFPDISGSNGLDRQSNSCFGQHPNQSFVASVCGIIFLCHDILELRMERAKSKLLELIHKTYKLHMLWTILEYNTASTVSTESTSPSRLSVSSTSSIGSIPSPERGWSQTFATWRISERQENATHAEINLVV